MGCRQNCDGFVGVLVQASVRSCGDCGTNLSRKKVRTISSTLLRLVLFSVASISCHITSTLGAIRALESHAGYRRSDDYRDEKADLSQTFSKVGLGAGF